MVAARHGIVFVVAKTARCQCASTMSMSMPPNTMLVPTVRRAPPPASAARSLRALARAARPPQPQQRKPRPRTYHTAPVVIYSPWRHSTETTSDLRSALAPAPRDQSARFGVCKLRHRLAPDGELMSELGAVPDQPAPTPEAMAELDLKCVNTVRSDPPFADRLKFVG